MATATARTANASAQTELERRMLRRMLLIRRFEEKAAEAYALGKIGGFCHLYIGQEAVAAGSLAALRHDDYVISSYREHGQALVRGVSAKAAMAELYGKVTGCSKGKGGSMHLFDAAKRFMGGHGIVGGHVPLAAGIGFAIKYQGGDQVCLCYFGEAAVNIGAFHEALNMSSVYHLPVIFCCENNRYGMGTAFERVAAVTDVVEHACSYDMAAELVNGMDVIAVYEATRRAAERARKGRPTLLEVRTYRFMGHSMSDPLHGVYRTKEEVEEQRKRDPISQLAGKLKEEGVLDEAGRGARRGRGRPGARGAGRRPRPNPHRPPPQLATAGWALQLAAQHSQAWDSWLSHIPGLKVVAPATPADAKGLLKSAIRDNNPVIVLEGEMLYNLKGEVPEGEHLVPIGRADVKRPGRDVTFICHSKTVAVALKAAEQLAEREGASAEVLDLRSLRPLDEEAIVGSVARTNRAVVIEEGWPHAGIGAQVVDIIQREAFDQLDAPVLRVTQADVPMPYNKQLERLAKPSADRVVAAARRVLYLD